MIAPTYPTVTRCARCGALETAHEIRGNGTRGQRLGQTAGATTNIACPGFEPGEVVEMVPESELRRRLDAVLALHVESRPESPMPPHCPECLADWPCETARAARGET